ncbi:MAG: hypothetical protein K9N07_01465 [Candidatus Cloacimonetes bacterium]|nr:hypothetical protein [Candidatus Cloacimonadota bacterium]
MALIICRECGKEISDQSNACLNCGCPIIIKPILPAGQYICPACGNTVKPISKFEFSTFLLLCFMMLLPGLIYLVISLDKKNVLNVIYYGTLQKNNWMKLNQKLFQNLLRKKLMKLV